VLNRLLVELLLLLMPLFSYLPFLSPKRQVLGLSTFSLHRRESGRTILPKGISKTINFSKYL
jgi:hypothetical protein